mmetsp:Transcript_86637/g.253584  ORF Transcript_86637/g.253584 Transcript_86637/m.253584 type:complete len:204 (+) Transcript_86637:709-1320(+)
MQRYRRQRRFRLRPRKSTKRSTSTMSPKSKASLSNACALGTRGPLASLCTGAPMMEGVMCSSTCCVVRVGRRLTEPVVDLRAPQTPQSKQQMSPVPFEAMEHTQSIRSGTKSINGTDRAKTRLSPLHELCRAKPTIATMLATTTHKKANKPTICSASHVGFAAEAQKPCAASKKMNGSTTAMGRTEPLLQSPSSSPSKGLAHM